MGVFLTGFSAVVSVPRLDSKSAELLEPLLVLLFVLFIVVVEGLLDNLSLFSILAKISFGDFGLLVSVMVVSFYVNLSKYRIYILLLI